MILIEIIPNWVSCVISLLSLLTSALICWQVYMAIDLHRVRRDIDKRIKKCFDVYNTHVSAVTNAIIAKLHYQNFLLLETIGYKTENPIKKHDLLECNLNSIADALNDLNKCPVKDSAPLIYKELICTIKYLSYQIYQLNNISLKTIDKVMRGVMGDSSVCEGVDKIDIINKLMKLKNNLKEIQNK